VAPRKKLRTGDLPTVRRSNCPKSFQPEVCIEECLHWLAVSGQLDLAQAQRGICSELDSNVVAACCKQHSKMADLSAFVPRLGVPERDWFGMLSILY
jgi:hypothetical protein